MLKELFWTYCPRFVSAYAVIVPHPFNPDVESMIPYTGGEPSGPLVFVKMFNFFGIPLVYSIERLARH